MSDAEEGEEGEEGQEGEDESDQDQDEDDNRILEEGLEYVNRKILASSRKTALSWASNLASVLNAFGKVASTAPAGPQARRASMLLQLNSFACASEPGSLASNIASVLASHLQKVHLSHDHHHERQVGCLG